jgi:hypothetical protein
VIGHPSIVHHMRILAPVQSSMCKGNLSAISSLSDLIISSVLVANMTPQSMLLPVTIGTRKQTVETQALLDYGASGKFIDSEFVKLHNILFIKLNKS